MKKLLIAAVTYMTAGLLAGLFYREVTRGMDPVPDSQLSTLHTHLLALGMIVMLVVLALDAIFHISQRKSFTWFFWLYNAGMVVTIVMMVVRGMLTIDGQTPEETTAAIPGIAGLGHMLLSAGLILLFIALWEPVATKAGEVQAAGDRTRRAASEEKIASK